MWVLCVVEYLERLHDKMVRVVIKVHLVVEAEIVTDGRKDGVAIILWVQAHQLQ